MRQISNILFSIIFFLLSAGMVNAQNTINAGDSLRLQVDATYRGELLWQFSTDSVNWETLNGSYGSDFSFLPVESGYIRSIILEENCDTLVSDVQKIVMEGIVQPPAIQEEYVTPELSEKLENTETVVLSTSDIVLPNGLTIEEFEDIWGGGLKSQKSSSSYSNYSRDVLIMKMIKSALFLSEKSNHDKSSDGDNRPAQKGLAYGAGLKNPNKREKPTAGECNRDLELYGLDCSGFIWQLFLSAGINSFPYGPAEKQRMPSTIKESIVAAYPDAKKTILVEDLEDKIGVDYLVTGDIIYWKNSEGRAYHIGMILNDKNGKKSVAQSNGSWVDCNKSGCGRCERNYKPETYKVGPRFFELTESNIKSFGENYGVVRIYTSDVKVTLSWNNMVDLDLHVIDPNGEKIYFENPISASGGMLDIDNVEGLGPENIYWQDSSAPIGEYQVFVHFYDGELTSSNYTVRVQAFGIIDETYTGSIGYDELVHVVNFNNSGVLTEPAKKSYFSVERTKNE